MPEFSVVIPLFNKEHFIKKTIQSVIEQTYQNFELIVIDDGSTDNSLAKVKAIKDSRIKIFQQKNSGASLARNKGAEHSKYNWIAFLDADDIWYRDHLNELNKSIVAFPEAQVVSNAYEIALNKNFIKKPKSSRRLPKNISIIKDYFSFSYIDPLLWTSSLAVKKQCFNDIGGFDSQISSGQDTDLICRLALSYQIIFNPKTTFLHIKHTENNLSKSNNLDSRLKFLNKFKAEENTNPSLKKYLDINRFSFAI
jgi:glycosyltransferase involved in cell wall biosynthesis